MHTKTLKIMTLNLWGGQVYEPLLAFLKQQSSDIDIFCFQEALFGVKPELTLVHKARINLFAELKECLSNFNAYTYPAPQSVNYFQSEKLEHDTRAGQSVFVKKHLNVNREGGFRTYKVMPEDTTAGGQITGSCQWVEIENNLTVLNLHGIWQKDTNKADTPERLMQSQIINNFISKGQGKKVLCGDFNLRPDGESIKKLEANMVNLIKKYGVTSTRSELYKKSEKFADYVFVSPELEVQEFQVLSDTVSDHLPLLLTIEV